MPILPYPLQLLSDESNFSSYQLQEMNTAHHLRLDAAAASALCLEPVPGEPVSSSLLGLLNKCRTPQGQRLLVQWLKQPLMDKSSIGQWAGRSLTAPFVCLSNSFSSSLCGRGASGSGGGVFCRHCTACHSPAGAASSARFPPTGKEDEDEEEQSSGECCLLCYCVWV